MKDTIRLDKYLTEMGKGTRSQIKEMARKGRITVNGMIEKRSERRVVPDADEIALDGGTVAYKAYEYYMLNKPAGVVSATADRLHQTALSLLTEKGRSDLFPAGRLDIDTEGLLLLTNDGALAHRLLSPKKHVDKVYYAIIEGELPADAALSMEAGLVLKDGTKTLPACLEILPDGVTKQGRPCIPSAGRPVFISPVEPPLTEIRLTIREGKFHQVKRMFERLGCHVIYLKRLSMGGLILDESLKPGEYRALTKEEADRLNKTGQENMHD